MKTILLLHGATGSQEDLFPFKSELSPCFKVHTLNFYGHGGEPITDDFSVEQFARQVLDWMDDQQLEKVYVVGYSLGGYVALYLALMYPDKVEKVITVATKLYWDVSIAQKEIRHLDAERMETRYPEIVASLQQKHKSENWRMVLSKTADMLHHIGRFNPIKLEDYSKIKAPVLLIVGDRDKSVSFVETTTVYKELPHAQMAVLPNTAHSLNSTNLPLLAQVVNAFVTA